MMIPGLYLAVRLLTADAAVPCQAQKQALKAAFPHSTAYVDALCPGALCAPCRAPSEAEAGANAAAHTARLSAGGTARRVSSTRLAALALLPLLLQAADAGSADLRLSRDTHGRPYAALPDGTVPFDFNLTHSDRHIACVLYVPTNRPAVADTALSSELPPRVGLDIEEPIPPARAARLAARYATEGERRLLDGAFDGALDSASHTLDGALDSAAHTLDRAGLRPQSTPCKKTKNRQNSPNHRDLSPWLHRGSTVDLPYTDEGVRSAEHSFLPPVPDFTLLWTAREAIAKQDGRGGPWRFDAASPPPACTLLSTRLSDTGASLTLCLPTDAVYAFDAIRLL